MICGHDRKTLRWALTYAKSSPEFSARLAKHTQETTSYAGANQAVHDPAKLAAIIAELMRESGLASGVFASSREYADTPISGAHCDLITSRAVPSGMTIALCRDDDAVAKLFDLTMPQARAFALALLDAPQATTQDIERMIGEL